MQQAARESNWLSVTNKRGYPAERAAHEPSRTHSAGLDAVLLRSCRLDLRNATARVMRCLVPYDTHNAGQTQSQHVRRG